MNIASKAKAYASGLAAFVGTVSIILATQSMPYIGIQYINQYQWSTVALAVLASYGITWRVPNAPPVDSASLESPQGKKRGDHVA